MSRSEWSELVRIGPFRIRVSRSEWSGVSSRDTGSDQPSDHQCVSTGMAVEASGFQKAVGLRGVFWPLRRPPSPAVISVELRYRRTALLFGPCYKWLKSVGFTAHG